MEKAFLFEVVSKLYIATDSAPVDIANFAICSEMIDVFIDISYIYSLNKTPG
jgi:Ras-related GTP-binding protein C/D